MEKVSFLSILFLFVQWIQATTATSVPKWKQMFLSQLLGHELRKMTDRSVSQTRIVISLILIAYIWFVTLLNAWSSQCQISLTLYSTSTVLSVYTYWNFFSYQSEHFYVQDSLSMKHPGRIELIILSYKEPFVTKIFSHWCIQT